MRGTRQKRSVLASAVVCAVAATGTVTLTATAGSGGRLILDAAGPPLAAATEPEPIEPMVHAAFPGRPLQPVRRHRSGRRCTFGTEPAGTSPFSEAAATEPAGTEPAGTEPAGTTPIDTAVATTAG